jgi:hypothetical protein
MLPKEGVGTSGSSPHSRQTVQCLVDTIPEADTAFMAFLEVGLNQKTILPSLGNGLDSSSCLSNGRVISYYPLLG